MQFQQLFSGNMLTIITTFCSSMLDKQSVLDKQVMDGMGRPICVKCDRHSTDLCNDEYEYFQGSR